MRLSLRNILYGFVCLLLLLLLLPGKLTTKRKPIQQPASTIQQEILPNPNNVIMIRDEFRMNELEDVMKQLDIQIQKLDLHMNDS